MSFVNYPTYQTLYKGELPELENLLSDIPTEVVISFICFINSEKHLNPHDVKKDIEIFKNLIGRLGKEANHLWDKMNDFGNKTYNSKQGVTIFPLPHMLQLIEFSIKHFVPGKLQEISPQQEENILKAILIINGKEEEKHLPKLKTNENPKDGIDHFAKLTWPLMLPTNEFSDRKDILIPLYQSLSLLKFLSETNGYKDFLGNYLKACNVSEPEEYLRRLMAFYLNGYDKSNKRFYTFYSDESIAQNPLLNQFILNVNEDTSEKFRIQSQNFRLLREKPILVTGNEKHLLYQSLLKTILIDTTIESDSSYVAQVLRNFRDTTLSNTEMGKLAIVADSISQGDTTFAQNLNALVFDSRCAESYQKTVNEIYLRTWARNQFFLKPADSLTLQLIAYEDPIQCGPAVYDARVMVGLDLNDFSPEMRSDEKPQEEEMIIGKVGVLYPNPASTSCVYEAELDMNQTGIVEMYNINGEILQSIKLTEGFNRLDIDLTPYQNGVYVFKIVVDGELIETKRLVITK